MSNAFVDVNKRRIDSLLYKLEEYNFKGSYGGDLSLLAIISLIKSLRNEIKQVQIKLENAQDQLKKYEKQVN